MPSKAFKMALGCFKPQDSERRASKDVEKKLSLWMKEYNKAIKILLLGAGESGKTTIIKQMKILHIQGFSKSERLEKIRDIRANVLESIVVLVRQMDNFDIPLGSKLNYAPLEYISKIDMHQDFEYTNDFFDNVKKLWHDDGIQECYSRSAEYIIPDCAKYFLDRVSEVAQPDFIPTDQDILQSRRTTTDIQKIEFEMKIPRKYGGGTQNFWMFDVGGQRGERRKWIQVFDGIHTILFLVACNTFDQVLSDAEDPNTNRLQEAINLFQDVWSSRFLQDSGFIVFLNKQDLLKKKVESGASIGHYFPEYYNYIVNAKDGDNNDEYIRTRCFIRDMFWIAKDTAPPPAPRKFSLGPGFAMIQEETHRVRDCYWHFTTATDTNNIQTVFEDVHHMIINQNLELLGLT